MQGGVSYGYMGKEWHMEEMRMRAIHTLKYEADIGRLIKKRLRAEPAKNRLQLEKSAARMYADDVESEELWFEAVALLLQRDIAYLELADRVNALPFRCAEKGWILRKAARLLRSMPEGAVQEELRRFYKENDDLNLEGFILFRAVQLQRAWEACIRQAAEELLLQTEYMKLVGLLSSFIHLQEPRMENIYIVLHPDGGCTLTDDYDARIHYTSGSEDGIISILISLAPAHITVYDLSGGRSATLAQVLLRIFEDKVKYFK